MAKKINKQPTQGILLIAAGNPVYLAMAQNLAAGIRAADLTIKIAIATDNQVPEKMIGPFFDLNIILTSKMITQGGKEAFIKAKTFMYDISPFDETIFLDVDQAMLMKADIRGLFRELSDIEFTMSNTGLAEQTIWCDMSEAKQLYGDRPYWNYHSELVYFKKSERAKQFFDAAKKIFSDAKLKTAVNFGGAPMADELAFQCASMQTGIYPHKGNWTPNFWWARESGAKQRVWPYQLKDQLTYSIGGNNLPQFVKDNYMALVEAQYKKAGLDGKPNQIQSKRIDLKNRQKV